jgi:aryl-alcohol dehydrogenase-like predicted oxidoreductase
MGEVAKRRLGRTGLEVSEVGYGSWGLGGKQWLGGDDEEGLRALNRALDLGVNFIDTALAYGDGHSEQLVGQVLRSRPGEAYVATKVPPKNGQWPGRGDVSVEDVFPAEYVVECTEQSLRNLGVEQVDVQQLHVWHDNWLDGTWRDAAEQLKRDGKVRFFSVSIDAPEDALAVVRAGAVDSLQVVYNIFTAAPADELFGACTENDVGVIARVPFDEGSLTGTVTPETKVDRWERVQGIVADLGIELSELPELALRFCLSSSEVSTVIPGMRKVRNVEANVAAAAKGPLDAQTLEVLAKYRR